MVVCNCWRKGHRLFSLDVFQEINELKRKLKLKTVVGCKCEAIKDPRSNLRMQSQDARATRALFVDLNGLITLPRGQPDEDGLVVETIKYNDFNKTLF